MRANYSLDSNTRARLAYFSLLSFSSPCLKSTLQRVSRDKKIFFFVATRTTMPHKFAFVPSWLRIRDGRRYLFVENTRNRPKFRLLLLHLVEIVYVVSETPAACGRPRGATSFLPFCTNASASLSFCRSRHLSLSADRPLSRPDKKSQIVGIASKWQSRLLMKHAASLARCGSLNRE